MSNFQSRLVLGSFILLLSAGNVQAGVTFTATTRSEGTGFDIGRAANSTVQGWAQGSNAKIEYMGKPGDTIPEGNVILTTDGGQNTQFYDTTRRMCNPWTGNAVVVGGSGDRPRPVKQVENLEIQKISEEAGAEIAGLATRHYSFRISYSSTFSVSGKSLRSQTEVLEELWMTDSLAEPALKIWLDSSTWPSGDAESDKKIAATLAEAKGLPLKRISSLAVDNEGGRDLNTKITFEVNTLETADIPESNFKGPFRCAGDAHNQP